MARTPDEARPDTAQWLIHARKAAGFRNAKPFLAAVKAEEGTAPSYSSYAQWESGAVTPRAETLEPIRRFHAKREALLPKPKPEPTPEEKVLQALNRQTTALERQTAAIDRLVGVMMLGQRSAADPLAVAEIEAFVAEVAPQLASALRLRRSDSPDLGAPAL